MADIRDRIIPRFGEGDAHGHVHHHPCGGVGVSLEIPAETKAINEEAVSMLEEAKRLFGYAVIDVQQSVESGEDEGVNVLTFTFKDGSTKEFKIRNGSHGLDGNIAEIEEAIERANKAATKAEAAEKLKEAYAKLVVRGLAAEDAGTIQWSAYDPQKYVAWDREQTLGIDQQDQARENINAASQSEFAVLQQRVEGMRENHDSYVGVYEKLSAAFRAKLEAAGYDAGSQYVWFALQYLFDNAGLNTDLGTTAQTTNPAVNEVLAEIPEIEDSDINMVHDVFI